MPTQYPKSQNSTPGALAIIGLGYVGQPLAVEFGKHRPVLGFDITAARVAELRAGQDHTLEVSPAELKESAHLRFSADPADLKCLHHLHRDGAHTDRQTQAAKSHLPHQSR